MHLTCYFGPNVDLYFVGRVLAGLYEQPGVRVKLRLADWITNNSSLGVEFGGRRLAIELSDHADYWDNALLDWSDVYSKRSLLSDYPHARSKIIPFGLHCAGHSKRSMAAVFLALAPVLPSSFQKRWKEYYRYMVTPHWRDFEYAPDAPVTDTILYQTRVWEHAEAPGDVIVNEERVSLLRELRRTFKHRFAGGLVPTPYAKEHYPDLIASQTTRQPQYIQWAKRSAIGIYSRGLFGSHAFKMAEFLASSKCVVSDPIYNLLPAPLQHIPTFRDNAECLTLCDTLLSQPKMLSEHRHLSWQYYQDYVQPKAIIARLLKHLAEPTSPPAKPFSFNLSQDQPVPQGGTIDC